MRKGLFGILASVAVIVSACGGATTSTAPSAAAPSTAPGASAAPASAAPSVSDMADVQELRIDIGNEPPHLDFTKASDSVSISVLKAITRGLVYYDKDLKVVPELAEKYDVSADAKTITFTLKDGIKYSNGDPILAKDFVYGWKKLMDPRTAADYAYVSAEVDGAPELLALAGKKPPATDAEIDALLAKAGVSAPDDKTFIVKLNTPATYFLSAAALWVFNPLQEKWDKTPNNTEAANYLASGPFKMETWQHNSEIVLVPNPEWTGTKPKLAKVTMTMTAEPAQAQAAFENNELDMVAPPTEDIKRIQADPELGPLVQQGPVFSLYYYVYDTTKGPTANKDFRIALTQAIDKKALIDATFSGIGQVANSVVMPGIPGYDDSINPYPYDPAAAKASMTKALAALGVASAADLGKLKFGFNTGGGHETKVAFMAEAWRQTFGLETEQVGSEWSVFLDARHDLQYPIARSGWGADYPHANNQLSGLFTCGGGNNDTGWCSKEFDGLLAQAAIEVDQSKQEALYKQAQTLLMADAPMIALRWSVATYEVRPYVGGIQATGSDSQLPGDQFFETMYIKKQ